MPHKGTSTLCQHKQSRDQLKSRKITMRGGGGGGEHTYPAAFFIYSVNKHLCDLCISYQSESLIAPSQESFQSELNSALVKKQSLEWFAMKTIRDIPH